MEKLETNRCALQAQQAATEVGHFRSVVGF
jgi:hypothetical protein